jgi:hypothetical protein
MWKGHTLIGSPIVTMTNKLAEIREYQQIYHQEYRPPRLVFIARKDKKKIPPYAIYNGQKEEIFLNQLRAWSFERE